MHCLRRGPVQFATMGKASCKDCGQGTFQDVVKASCKDSGQGKFQNVADQVICVDCGADNCVDCGTDKYAATKRALSNSAQATRIIQLALRIKTCRSCIAARGGTCLWLVCTAAGTERIQLSNVLPPKANS